MADGIVGNAILNVLVGLHLLWMINRIINAIVDRLYLVIWMKKIYLFTKA